MLHRSPLERRNSTQNNKTDLGVHDFLLRKELAPIQIGKKKKVDMARLCFLLHWSNVALKLVMLLYFPASALETRFQFCVQGNISFLTLLQFHLLSKSFTSSLA